MFPRLDPKIYPIEDDQAFFLEVLQETRVMLVQGTGFNWPQPDHFRIVFLPHEDDLREAIGRLARFLETCRKRFGTDHLVPVPAAPAASGPTAAATRVATTGSAEVKKPARAGSKKSSSATKF